MPITHTVLTLHCRKAALFNNKTDPFAEACKLIQNQVDVGILESAVLHVHRDRNSQLRAFGKAQSGDAIFLIASITKPMTATGLKVLADRGELKLSDKVVKFIPEFSEGDRKDIAIQYLLTHSLKTMSFASVTHL
jgi:CubicO group peptidase (beta-lactamase class C family)